jgi:hypothetical protein
VLNRLEIGEPKGVVPEMRRSDTRD